MNNFQLSNILAKKQNKVVLDSIDLSIAGISASHGLVSYLVDGNLSCSAIQVDIHCMYGDIATTAPFTLSEQLDLSKLVSPNTDLVEAEINSFLNRVQLGLIVNSHLIDSFLDEEYDQLDQVYPNLNIVSCDFDQFANTPFKTVQSTDDTTSVFGFISETMYFITDKILPITIFEAVRQLNTQADLDAFSRNAVLPSQQSD